MKTKTYSLPLYLRKWMITFAFAGFLAGLGIGAYVAHKQQTTTESAAPPTAPTAQQK